MEEQVSPVAGLDVAASLDACTVVRRQLLSQAPPATELLPTHLHHCGAHRLSLQEEQVRV